MTPFCGLIIHYIIYAVWGQNPSRQNPSGQNLNGQNINRLLQMWIRPQHTKPQPLILDLGIQTLLMYTGVHGGLRTCVRVCMHACKQCLQFERFCLQHIQMVNKMSSFSKQNWLAIITKWAELTAMPFDVLLSRRLPVTNYCSANSV